MNINLKKKKAIIIYFIALLFTFSIAQITIEKTIPQEIQISDIREFVINVNTKTIDIHLSNGQSYYLSQSNFLNFWNNSMTQTQRNTVRGFIKQLSALAANVDVAKVTGDF